MENLIKFNTFILNTAKGTGAAYSGYADHWWFFLCFLAALLWPVAKTPVATIAHYLAFLVVDRPNAKVRATEYFRYAYGIPDPSSNSPPATPLE